MVDTNAGIAQAVNAIEEQKAAALSEETIRWLKDQGCIKLETPADASHASDFQVVTINETGVGGGKSEKPYNVLLNWKRLILTAGGTAITLAGFSGKAPWMILLSATIILDNCASLAVLNLSENEAKVLWLLWRVADQQGYVSLINLYEKLRESMAADNLAGLSPTEIKEAVALLIRKRCVRHSIADSNSLRLVEEVKIKTNDPRLLF